MYAAVSRHSFIYYDDNAYVFENQHVTAGLNWNTVRWAVTSTEQWNWHPVTWLSHALDRQLFALDAGYHHLTNVVVHILNVLLLFFLLQKVTGSLGRSFLAAALFAWHPLNVESVAWVAERKNLLSLFFSLLTIGAYVRYVRKPGWKALTVVSSLFILALASKPMAVTLPFVLLLIDYWPLQRVAGPTQTSQAPSAQQCSATHLLLEKLPLFALSAASCAVTLFAQGRAVRSLQMYPFSVRLANAFQSYAVYLGKTVWPSRLAVYYPLVGSSLTLWKSAVAALILCAVSIIVWMARIKRPYLLVGWLWFVGMLVPVIGLVQVGDQAMADRYAYFPLIGLFVALVWGASDFFDFRRACTAPRWALASLALGALGFLTHRQISYWENDVSLWSHALQVTPDNETAESQIATAFVFRGDHDAALPHLIDITRLDPKSLWPHESMGAGYMTAGQLQDAAREFDTVVRLSDHSGLSARDRDLRASAMLNLGFAAILQNDYPMALMNFRRADHADGARVDQTIQSIERSLAAAPSANDYLELPLLLRAQGKDREALSILDAAIKANPDYADTQRLWSYLTALRE